MNSLSTNNSRTRRFVLNTFVISALLLFTWLIPFSRPAWDWLDAQTFTFLHYNLLSTLPQQQFWAVMNARIIDHTCHAITILMLAHYVLHLPTERKRRLKQAIFIVVAVILSVVASKATQSQLAAHINIKRDSPSIALGHHVELSKVLPGLENVKDSSRRSFPSDHAMTLFLFSLFFFYYTPKRYAYAMLFSALFFSTPRLVGGGHWLTDCLMGALPVATLAFALWMIFAYKSPSILKKLTSTFKS